MVTRVLVGGSVREFLGQLSTKKEDDKRIEDFKFILEKFTEDYYGGYPPLIEKVTTEDIALYFNYLQGCQFKFDPYRQDRKPPTLKPVRLEQAKKELYVFWSWVANKYGFSNPFIPRTICDDSKRIYPLSDDEMRRLTSVLNADNQSLNDKNKIIQKRIKRDTALVFLMIETGIRAEELERVVMRDIDFEKKNITIYNSNGDKRIMPLSKGLNLYLLRYSYRYISHQISSEEILFPRNNMGNPIDRKTLHTILMKLGEKAKVENMYALRLRATFVKYMIQDWLFEENAVLDLGLYNKYQLRLYIDEGEIKYKTKTTLKNYSPMDKWGF
jgi:integrase